MVPKHWAMELPSPPTPPFAPPSFTPHPGQARGFAIEGLGWLRAREVDAFRQTSCNKLPCLLACSRPEQKEQLM